LALTTERVHPAEVREAGGPLDELVDQVCRTTGLPAADARRVVDDVVAYFTATTEDYVRRRHRELQLRGVRNDTSFAVIAEELRRYPVRAPELSARQLRRIVYG
jgi:hypothetical protein